MKAANFLNILLAIALVLVCAKLHSESAENAEAFAQQKSHAMIAENAVVSSQPSSAKGDVAVLFPQGTPPSVRGDVAERQGGVSHSDVVVIDSTDLAPGVSGFGGPVPVIVEVKDGIVTRVEPKLPNSETPGFFKQLDEAGLWKAWDGLPVGVAATTRVDAVTSATYSSEAAIANVRAALASVADLPRETAAAPAPGFREFDIHADFAENPFTWFTGRGLLLCAGDREKSNAMTIGWGGLGTLWGRNDAVTVYVAEKRHTKAFMDKSARFTVMAFDKEKQANVLDYMGHHSGRDGDKAAALGLHLAYTADGTPYYEEAQLVLECELMYAAPFDPAGMKDIPSKLYANFPAGVHTMYIGRVVRAMKR